MSTKLSILLATLSLALLPSAFGQHGTARNVQSGSIHDAWLGTIISANDTTREITLASGSGETFTGVLKDHFSTKSKDGSVKELKPSDLPNGAKIIVCYEVTKTTGDGTAKSYNEIFRIQRATNIK